MNREWDPIGVGEIAERLDEYGAYAWQVWIQLAQHQPIDQLIDYLWWVETQYMGLTGDRPHTERIAERLVQLWSEIEAESSHSSGTDQKNQTR